MNRRMFSMIGIVVAVWLIVSAMPVAALQTNLAVASIHTTDTDFNAGTITNMTVTGSGPSATVEYTAGILFSDGFESDAADAGTPDSWTQNNAPTSQNVTTVRAIEGTQSWFVDSGTSASFNPTSQPLSQQTTKNASWSMWVGDDGSGAGSRILLWEGGLTGSAVIQVSLREGDLKYQNGTSGSWETITTAADEGEWVNVTVFGIDTAANEFDVAWSAGADSGTATDLDMSSGSSAGYDLLEVAPSSGVTAFYDDFAIGMAADTGSYVNNHSAEQTTQGFVNVTENVNATATVTWRGDSNGDGSFDTLLNQTAGVTTAANHTFTWSTFAGDNVQVNVTVQNASGNGDPTFTLADEGVQFTATEPSVPNSTASPTGDLSTSTPTLSIDVNDSDFPLTQGDSVDVVFFVDGSSIGTDTLTSNGSASQTISSGLAGGDHTWHVVATDSYGLSNTSDTFSISTPANLTIREETSPYPTVTGCSAEVRFFELAEDSPTIVERTDSDQDGNISLSGLPIDTEFVATIDCAGYHNRTVLIESLFDQQSAFLLNTSRTSVEVEFDINDETGDFGDDTDFIVQKAINRSEYGGSPTGFSWTNIGGDQIGATNTFTIDLEHEDRYRLKVQNTDGDTRILGSHTATSSQVVSITIQDITITIENESAEVQVGFEKDEAGNQLEFLYNDTQSETTDLEIIISERGNSSNEVYNQTHAGPVGEVFIELSLTASQMNTSWVAEFNGTRNGEAINGKLLVGDRLIDTLPIPRWVIEFGSVGAILLIPTLLGGNRAETGAVVAVAITALLWWLQFLPPEIGILTVVLAGTVAVGFKMRQRGQGNIR